MSIEMFQFTVASIVTLLISTGVCIASPKIEAAKLSKQMNYAVNYRSNR